MRTGELSESALDLLLTDIIAWPVRVLHRALSSGTTHDACTHQVRSTTSTSWDGASARNGWPFPPPR